MKSERAQPEVFEFESEAPATFPSACATCGKPTKKLMAVQVSIAKPASSELIGDFLLGLFGGPGAHLVQGFQTLKAGSVLIPCCTTCRRPYYLGNLGALVCLIGGGFGFVFSLRSNLPTWALFFTVIPSAVCLFGFFIPHMIGKSKALPATVWLEGSRYHYRFTSGAFRDCLLKLAVSRHAVPPPLPSSGPKP